MKGLTRGWLLEPLPSRKGCGWVEKFCSGSRVLMECQQQPVLVVVTVMPATSVPGTWLVRSAWPHPGREWEGGGALAERTSLKRRCLWADGIRGMLQGRSTQKLSLSQPSPAPVALPRGLCCLRGGTALEWT